MNLVLANLHVYPHHQNPMIPDNNIYGYQIIDSIQDDYISIKIYPNINKDLINTTNFLYKQFGGNNINLNLY